MFLTRLRTVLLWEFTIQSIGSWVKVGLGLVSGRKYTTKITLTLLPLYIYILAYVYTYMYIIYSFIIILKLYLKRDIKPFKFVGLISSKPLPPAAAPSYSAAEANVCM